MNFEIIDDKKKESPIWKRLKHDPKDIHCLHCKYKKAEDSIPKKSFKVKRRDGNGNPLPDKTINKIKVIRGNDDDVIGWVF